MTIVEMREKLNKRAQDIVEQRKELEDIAKSYKEQKEALKQKERSIKKAKKELEEKAYDLVIQMKGEGKSCRETAEKTGYSKSKVANIWVQHSENTDTSI